jgi:hypothetical protein
VPSSDDVMTNFLLKCRHVTALWCLLAPAHNQRIHLSTIFKQLSQKQYIHWHKVFRQGLHIPIHSSTQVFKQRLHITMRRVEVWICRTYLYLQIYKFSSLCAQRFD